MHPEIVITGTGVVSALGCGKAENLAALLAGRSGIAPVRYLQTALKDFPVGEVPLSDAELAARTGAPAEWPRTALMSILALQEALQEADALPNAFARTGSRSDAGGNATASKTILISGTTVGGMDRTEKTFPAYSPHHGCGAVTDLAALFVGGFDDATTLSTACSSAANAFIYGANLLRAGRCRRVVVGGSESLTDYHLHGFNSLMILDREPCRPFDASRAGLNLGEGAAYLVLETAEEAQRRGVKPLARLAGFGNACDAFHQTASSENGEGAFLAMQKALRMAGLSAEDIDYVNAHGTGTPNNDASESAALRRIFGVKMPPVSSTKAFTGHTTSASGSIEAVFCLLALQEGFIPPQLHLHTPDPACIIPCHTAASSCQAERSEAPLRHILSNAFGFGGNDTSLIFSRL